jgi:hypothetical protein
MGHSQISTTERYLHARPATELAERFTSALGPSPALATRDASVAGATRKHGKCVA